MYRALLAIVCLIAGICTAQAQNQQQSRERDAVRRAQAAVQKAEQEKARLLEEKSALEKEKAALDKKLKGNAETARQLAASRRKEQESRAALEAAQRDLEAARAKIAQLTVKSDELGKRLGETETQRKDLESQGNALTQRLGQQREIIARQAQSMQVCQDNNAKLYAVSQELLDRYHRKGVWDALLQKEPVTGLREVQMQNILQEYEDRAQALRVAKPELNAER